MAETLTLHCSGCRADKLRSFFVPSRQRVSQQGRKAYCMMCQKQQRKQSPGRTRSFAADSWKNKPSLFLPGSR